MPDIGIYISGGTLLLGVMGYVAKLTWKIRDLESDTHLSVDSQIDNVTRDLNNHQASVAERFDAMRHEAGEMGSALRTKIHEVETWNRDTFVRKESFDLVVSRFEKSLEKMTDRLENKIDKAIERFQRTE